MRKSGFILIILVAATFVQTNRLSAQEVKEAATLFGKVDSLSLKDIGFFIHPGLSLTEMDGDAASLFHLRAGLTAKDKWSAGGFMNVSVNHIYPVSETLPNIYMDFWSAGVFLEYTLWSKKMLHLTFPLFLGYGEVQMDGKGDDYYPDLDESNFFLVEPMAQMELNLHRNLRINAGAGYRWVSDMTYRNFNQSAISGLTISAGLKMGLFR